MAPDLPIGPSTHGAYHRAGCLPHRWEASSASCGPTSESVSFFSACLWTLTSIAACACASLIGKNFAVCNPKCLHHALCTLHHQVLLLEAAVLAASTFSTCSFSSDLNPRIGIVKFCLSDIQGRPRGIDRCFSAASDFGIELRPSLATRHLTMGFHGRSLSRY